MNKETTTPGITQGEEKLRQLFKNRSNCYAESDFVIQAMDEDCFIETVNEIFQETKISLEAMEKRLIDAESQKQGHFDHLMQYMQMVEEIVGFAGPVEAVEKALTAKITDLTAENQRLHQELDLRCAHVTAKDDLLKKSESENRELREKAEKLCLTVKKHHPTIVIPEQEDLYMSLHDLVKELQTK